ncbi:hypothetical protein [uncultured Lactobacillus sp.]|uniref:hypothetical protein n=1 Tax=uncultured Lactobacillus sp. TaxID=153152 RepID=UPI002620D2D6|nr:hypothetical protein [uncultured Lactobacillus sp.]
MSTDDPIMSREEAEIRLVAIKQLRSFLKSHKIKERSETGLLLIEFEKLLTDDFVNWTGKKESV